MQSPDIVHHYHHVTTVMRSPLLILLCDSCSRKQVVSRSAILESFASRHRLLNLLFSLIHPFPGDCDFISALSGLDYDGIKRGLWNCTTCTVVTCKPCRLSQRLRPRVLLTWHFLLRTSDNAKSRRMHKPSLSVHREFWGSQLERHRPFDRVTISVILRSRINGTCEPSAAEHAILA